MCYDKIYIGLLLKARVDMNIIKYRVNDVIELKKTHPCGGTKFKILRVGGVMRVICLTCSRDMEIDRVKLERATKKIIANEENNNDESRN